MTHRGPAGPALPLSRSACPPHTPVWRPGFTCWARKRHTIFFSHQKREFLEIHFRGRWEDNNETFFTLNFKMPISILKFKFPIRFALASTEGVVSGHGVCPSRSLPPLLWLLEKKPSDDGRKSAGELPGTVTSKEVTTNGSVNDTMAGG